MPRTSARTGLLHTTSASGVIYGIRLLELLKQQADVETHLIMSSSAKRTIQIETDWNFRDVEALANKVYSNNDQAAAISSGSFQTNGMLVAPCSMKTLSSIVHSYGAKLLTRAADVVLKETQVGINASRSSPACGSLQVTLPGRTDGNTYRAADARVL